MAEKVKVEREELAGLDVSGLRERLNDAKANLWKLRFELGKRQLTDTAELARTRKRIARIHTYLRQRELQETK